MSRRKTISWTVSPHAKQRAWERYGTAFSPHTWLDFCRTMQNQKNSCRLANDRSGSGRFACFFQNQWYLVGCRTSGTMTVITTFLPLDSLTDADKTMLRAHESSCRMNNDRMDADTYDHVIRQLTDSSRRRLAAIQIFPEELPNDFDQIDTLLKHFMQ